MRHYHYPKLTVFCAAIVLAYILFSRPEVSYAMQHLDGLNYIGIFVAGMLFSFGFTTPFAVGFLLTAEPSNIILAALLGGAGALLSDYLMFKTIKFSMMDEFTRIEHLHVVQIIEKTFKKNLNKTLRKYLLYGLAGFILASPLPDEWGVSILAGLTKITTGSFAIISYLCNSAGILVMLLI